MPRRQQNLATLRSEVFAPTFSAKTIYVYNSPDAGHDGLLKIGDASVKGLHSLDGVMPNAPELDAAAKKRIDSYTRTQGASYNLLRTELAVRKLPDGSHEGFRDHHVHRVLKNSGVEQVQPNGSTAREWFKTDLATSTNAIAAVKAGRKSLSAAETSETRTPFTPRPEQERFIVETIKALKKSSKYLWNAKMRFGKTVTALELVRRMGFKKTIIITHRPVVNDGWFKDFRDMVFVRPEDAASWVYGFRQAGIQEDDRPKVDELCEGDTKHLVYFASIQDLRGSKAVGGDFDKNMDVFTAHWDCIIVDEAHEGTQTALGDKVVKSLFHDEKTQKLLALSGTPFNILDAYRDSGVSTWDYVMEQTAKANWAVEHAGDANPYEDLPRLAMFVYDLAAEIGGYRAEDVRGSVFNFKEFFRVWTGNAQIDHAAAPEGAIGRFVHEGDVRRFLTLLCTPSASTCFPFATDENRAMFHHTFWLVPGVREALALQHLIEERMPGFCVVNVAGDGDPDDPSGEALAAVRDAIATHEYTITLSCGKLTTGVTVPEWSAVFMLAGRYETSAIRYLQTIFRVQSPGWLDGCAKENCYVYDFAPDRTLKVIADAARLSDTNRNSGGDDTDRRAAMGALLNFCPVIALKGSAMRPFDADALMQELKRALASRAILSGFADDSLYDDDMLRADRIDVRDFEKLRKVLKDAKIDEVPNGKFTVNKHGLTEEEREKAERAKKKPAKELSEEEKELLRRLREEREAKRNFKATLRAISVRMPLMLYGADGDWDEDISLDRFVELVDEASWAEFMPKGVTKKLFEKFKKYYDKDVFALSAKSIRREAQGADALFPEERIQILAEVFGRFRNPDKETVLTPWKVVNRQLSDTLGGYVFFDEDFKTETSVPRFVNQGDATTATLANRNAKILEINSKTGLYPLYVVYSLYRARLGGRTPTTVEEANEVWDAVCRENMFVLTLTPMAKSITHRTLVGYRNASTRIKVMPNLVKRLKDNTSKVAAEIKNGSTWGSQGSFAFDAVVGNPTYQEDDGGFASSASPVYNTFVDAAIALRPRFVTLITPSRWFVGGKGLDDFRSRLLADHHLSLLVDFPLLYEPFSNVKIRGGISYFLWDSGYNGPCTVTTMEGGKAVGKSDTRFLDEFDVLVRRNEAVPILRKVLARKEQKMDEEVSSRKPFGFPTNFKGADSATGITDAIKLYGNQKITWIDRSAVTTNAKWIDEWKVLMTAVQGTSSAVETRFLSNPIVAGPGTACTETYIVAGHFASKSKATNLANYLRTRFVRFLVSLRKATQHATRDVYAFVPHQDFTSSSDIDWSRSV
ncbi:MAG: Eco57I restriction-modification methylase domain-containing protein [Kiritimatiellae bacterium]|nr:Eco57I restriction-modification methylase domain-containing protein [Kiritimatiellia bacterium]